MARKRRLLVALSLLGWTGAMLSHLLAARSGADGGLWEQRRNQCMLVGSLASNTLTVLTIYRFLVRRRTAVS